MRVNIPYDYMEEVMEQIRKLDNMSFEEITDGNKQSDLFGIISILTSFKLFLEERIDV